MKSRFLRPILLALLVGGGVLFWQTTVRPEPRRLSAWAEEALKEIFGPGVTHGEVRVDLLEGVFVRDLRVPALGAATGAEPALSADEVEIQHDVLALSAGVPRLRRVILRGPRISTHETESGEVALDFPFELPKGEGPVDDPPAIVVEGGEFRLKASPTSKKFQPGYVLVLGELDGRATPGPGGTLAIEGHLLPRGVGLERNEEIRFQGTANPTQGLLDVYAVWERLRLTPEVRGILATELMQRLSAQRLAEGPHRLAIHLARDPQVEAGRVRVSPQFRGTMKVDISGLPGTETIDAETREQINALFGQLDLNIEMSGGRIDVRELSTSLAGGQVKAVGRIEDGGAYVDLDLTVTGLRLDDPALLKALGPLGKSVLAEFGVQGAVDATVTLRRARGGPMRWEAAVDLVDATIVYYGRKDPVRRTPAGNPLHDGFPYAAEHCFGRIYVTPEGARIDAIEGRHGLATIRVRGTSERSRAGGPTGSVSWAKGDTDVMLTVEATDVPIDRDLEAAVEGSEFAGFLDTYRPSGALKSVVVDIGKRSDLDALALVEVDVDLENAGFTFSKFPLPLADVTGRVSLLRPVLRDGTRGKEFHVRAKGLGAEGLVEVVADFDERARRGRVRVTGTGVHVEGPLTDTVLGSEPGKGGLGDAWRFLRPSGRADVVADLPASDDPGPERYEVRLRDAEVRLGGDAPDAGVRVEHLTGAIQVVGGRVAIDGVAGRIGESEVRFDGTIDGGPEGAWDLKVGARALRLTEGLLAVIASAAGEGAVVPPGVVLEPGGRLDLDLGVKRQAGKKKPLSARVAVADADLTARIGDLSMHVRGGFSVDGDDVRLEALVAEGRGIRIEVPRARLGPNGLEGGLTARLTDVAVGPEVLGLLPASLRPTFAEFTKDRLLQANDLSAVVDERGAVTVRGALGLKAVLRAPAGGAPRGLVEFAPVTVSAADQGGRREVHGTLLLHGLDLDVGTRLEEVRGRLDVATLRVGEDPVGQAALRLDTVRVAGLLLKDTQVPLAWSGGILRAGPIAATLYGGRLAGEVSVHTRDPLALEGRLAVDGLSLDLLRGDLGSGPEVRGTAALDLEFQSRSPSFRDFTASGTASVRDGDLGELPPVANLPALFASFMPASSKPRFERADASFTIADEALRADRLRLSGPLFDLDGFGTLDFAGNLDLTLTPQFLKSMVLPGALQMPGIGQVVGLFREDPLYVVRVRGDLATAKPVLEPLPFLGVHRSRPEFQRMPSDDRPERRIPRLFR